MLELDEETLGQLGYGADRASFDFARLVNTNSNRVLIWRLENPEAFRALDKRFKQSKRGKEIKARTWKKYYAKNRARLIAKNKAVRAAQKKVP